MENKNNKVQSFLERIGLIKKQDEESTPADECAAAISADAQADKQADKQADSQAGGQADKGDNNRRRLSVFAALSLISGALSALFYVCYVVFLFVAGKGNAIVNYCLLAFTSGYLVFYLISMICTLTDRGSKTAHKIGIKTYKMLRRLMILANAFIVGGSIINLRAAGGLFMWISVGVAVLGFLVYVAFTIIMNIAVKKLKNKFGGLIKNGQKEKV